MSFDVHELDTFVLVGSAVTLLAILAVRLSSRAGLPSLLIYLLMGVALGEASRRHPLRGRRARARAGVRRAGDHPGRRWTTTSWREMRPSIRLGVSLATIGVAVSVTIVALGAHYLLGLPWELAVLLGAVTSPTDAAAVFSVLRVVPLPKSSPASLEAESGLNDAPTVVLVTLVASGAVDEHGPLALLGIIGYELAAGTAIGLAVGFGGAWVMRRAALPSSGLYPLAVLALAFLAYGVATSVHASGFAAVYVAALVLGNMELPHRAATRSFAEGVAWLAQIGLFVMLGLLLSPGRITWRPSGSPFVAGLILTFVARPLSVLVSAVVQPMPWRELGFISWAGLRGAVPIVLMTIPLAEGIDDAEAALRHRLRDGRRLHPADRPDAAAGGPGAQGGPAVRAARPRGRGGAARADRGRPAPGHDQPGLADARRRGRRAAAAAGLLGVDGDPRRQDARPRAAYRPAARRRPAGRHAAQAARADRGAAAPGERARPAGAVARREGAPYPR